MRGYRILATHLPNDHAQFGGQTDSDWSAVYVQFTAEHALRYLATRFERNKKASLAAIEIDPAAVRFISCGDEVMRDGGMGSGEKAQWVRRHLAAMGIKTDQRPLLEQLGRMGIALICLDNETDREMVVPHSLMQDPNVCRYSIVAKFYKDSCGFECKTGDDDQTVHLDREEKRDIDQFVKKILATIR